MGLLRPPLRVALLAGLLLGPPARTANAQSQGWSGAGSMANPAEGGPEAGGESLRALNAAKAALAAIPPDRDTARGAFARAAAAADDPGAMAEAYFRLGFLEEEDGAFERALTDQRACMAKAPFSPWARSARQRIRWMTARSDGDFQPLARLQLVRRNPALGNDPAAIDALARDAEAFPPGRVRAEARAFVAEAWLTRMNRPQDAIPELRKVTDDPSSDATDADLARRHLVQAFLAVGRIDDAASAIRTSPALDPELSAQVQQLLGQRMMRRLAAAALLALALLVASAIAAASRTRPPATPSSREC